jgi:hypothetical protein
MLAEETLSRVQRRNSTTRNDLNSNFIRLSQFIEVILLELRLSTIR